MAFLQVTVHLSCLANGLVKERISVDHCLVRKLIYCFLWFNSKQRTSMDNRHFIIMGHTVKMNVSLSISIKTRILNVKHFSQCHIL